MLFTEGAQLSETEAVFWISFSCLKAEEGIYFEELAPRDALVEPLWNK